MNNNEIPIELNRAQHWKPTFLFLHCFYLLNTWFSPSEQWMVCVYFFQLILGWFDQKFIALNNIVINESRFWPGKYQLPFDLAIFRPRHLGRFHCMSSWNIGMARSRFRAISGNDRSPKTFGSNSAFGLCSGTVDRTGPWWNPLGWFYLDRFL